MNDNWEEWASLNSLKINEGFEKDFVRLVLSQIPEIDPSDVIAQYTFKDSINKNRRIDFVIQNKSSGHFLAIELDGARRGRQETQAQWADFLQRQNDLLELVGPLLRFSNSQMFKNPQKVIERIRETLFAQSNQAKQKAELQSEHDAKSKDLLALQKRLKEAQKSLTDIKSNAESLHKKNELERQLANAKKKQDAAELEYNRQSEEVEKSNKKIAHIKIEQLEYALHETGENLQTVSKENVIMLRTMMFIAAVVVISMIIIVTKTDNSTTEKFASSNEVKHENNVTPATPAAHKLPPQTSPQQSDRKIEAFKAPFHIGESIMTCGKLVEIKHLSKRVYLNLDKKYPSQTLTILIWNNNIEKFEKRLGSLESLVGKRVCVQGTINEYKNNLQVKVSNENFLRVIH